VVKHARQTPTELKYTKDHEWLTVDSDISTVGITAHAADALGDIVYLQLPDVGVTLTAGEVCGEIESTATSTPRRRRSGRNQ
jgi:glycine cleavage system H protein